MTAAKTFSRLGLAMFLFLLSANVSSFVMAFLVEFVSPGVLQNSDIQALLSFASVDVIGLAVFWMVVRTLPKFTLRCEKHGVKKLFVYFSICIAVSVFGAVIGSVLSYVVSGGTAQNYVEDIMSSPGLFTVIDVAVLAPIAEELICRKFIIDRCVQFGERNAVVFSAILFGCVHGNFYQFFYAAGIGLVFGYIYVRSGKIRYTIALHIAFNLLCGVVPSFIAPDNVFFVLFEYLLLILGIAFAVAFRKRIFFRKTVFELERGPAVRAAYINFGMFLFFIISIFEFVLALF